MITPRRRGGLAWAALAGWLGALHGGCAATAPRAEAVVSVDPVPSPAVERAVPDRPPPPLTTPREKAVTEGTPPNDAGCPEKLPEPWTACDEQGLKCRYPCASAPRTVLELVCAHENFFWVPNYELEDCP